jgi:hypothetical protein
MEISVNSNQQQNGLPSAAADHPLPVRRPQSRPSPEVAADARRRTFSLDYELRILQEAETVNAVGEISALLRREVQRPAPPEGSNRIGCYYAARASLFISQCLVDHPQIHPCERLIGVVRYGSL